MTPLAYRSVSPSMRMNLTSMIDVIFLILIYFVVTANFAVGEGVITAKMPQAMAGESLDTPPQIPLRIKVIAVGRSGYRLELPQTKQSPDGSQGALSGELPGVGFSELASLLRQMQYSEANPSGLYRDDVPVVVEPQGRVRWQHVVNAFHAAVVAGYKNVSFARAGE